MRSKPMLMAVALTLAAMQPAFAQVTPANAQSLDAVDLPSNATLSGPGPITASPTRPADAPTGKRAMPTRSTPLPARVLGNGTAMSYGEAGANAIGNTGGLTTGPQGSAGAVAGGGGVHSGALVIPPGPVNGAMHSDESREHLTPQATGGSGAQQ
jgi:hypothetical protein